MYLFTFIGAFSLGQHLNFPLIQHVMEKSKITVGKILKSFFKVLRRSFLNIICMVKIILHLPYNKLERFFCSFIKNKLVYFKACVKVKAHGQSGARHEILCVPQNL